MKHKSSYPIDLVTLFTVLIISFNSMAAFTQQKFIHTASKTSISCNYDCTLLDNPGLNKNADAIIWVTPVIENGVNPNPHPICVYYFKEKWSILNLDGNAIPEGAKFTITYTPKPDESHFQYSITKEDLQRDGTALIDHPALNNNPSSVIKLFPSWNPQVQGATTNRDDVTIQYNTDAGKWYVSNISKKPLFARVAFNIIISTGGKVSTPPAMNNALQINELVIAVVPPSVSGPVFKMYMTAWADGIKLPGDNLISPFLDKIQLFGFELTSLKPYLSGKPGNPVYEPVTLNIHSGLPATVPFFNALVKNQEMAFTIDVLSQTPAGAATLNYTIRLTGGRVVGFAQHYQEIGLSLGQESQNKIFVDELKIVFTKIEFIKDGTTVEDNL